MKALVFHGPGSRHWEDAPEPTLAAPTDIIIRVDASTICGSDLHILKGDVPTVKPGTILGHEAVGTVTEVGDAVTTVEVGDRVLASCITSCGRCEQCKAARYGLCTGGGGWILGHLIDGVQAEYARIPFADTSVYKVPTALTDEQVLFLADILPTSFEVGVLNGHVKPGDTVAVIGAGPVGLAAVLTASLFTPSRIIVIDRDATRLARAIECGASDAIELTGEAARARVLELTDGVGVDVAIEAVGIPETFELCTDIVRSGGHVANVGVHGKPATLHLDASGSRRDDHDRARRHLVDAPTMNLVDAGKLDPLVFVTHRFPLEQTEDAYDAFAAAQEPGAFKVVLEGAKHQQLVPVGAAAGLDGDASSAHPCNEPSAEHESHRAPHSPRLGRLPRANTCPSWCAATWHGRFPPADSAGDGTAGTDEGGAAAARRA